MADSNWKRYWQDTRLAPIERIVQWWKETFGYKRFAKYIPKGEILEIGSGKGIVSKYLKDLGYAITTSDVDPELKCDMTFDARYIPYPTNFFDTCMSTGLMEHFSDGDFLHSLKDQVRVARRTIISVPEKSMFWHILWTFRKILGAKLDLHFNLRSKQEMHDFLVDNDYLDFHIDRERFGIFFPYIVITCRS